MPNHFAECIVVTSDDNGESWEGGLMLDEHPCSYPFGYQAENGTVYVSYERSHWNQPEILMARFTEEDVSSPGRSCPGAPACASLSTRRVAGVQ